MNRPTPDPSQEGSKRTCAPCQSPSWEGTGVGSWFRCALKMASGLSMNRGEWGRRPACHWGDSPQNSSRARRPRRQPGRLSHY